MKLRAVFSAVIAAGSISLAGTAPIEAADRPGDHLTTVRALPVRTVTVADLPRAGRGGSHRLPMLLSATRTSTSSPSTAYVVTDAVASTATSSPALQLIAGFTGMTVQKQTSDFSANGDQNVAPPDTQLAAGPTNLLEMVNSTGSVWNKDGTFVTDFDLNVFYGLVGTGYSFSDPRVLYDALSGRWFSTGVAYTSSFASEFVLAVSTSGDPTGTWNIYAAAQSSLLHDQPKLGISTDKVAIAWNDFQGTSFFEGATTWVLQKSPLLTGSPAPGTAIGPNSNQSGIVPAQHLADSSVLYLVYNNSDCGYTGCNTGSPTIGIISAGGTPGTNTFTWTESDPGLAGTSNPPSADQPTLPASIDTNDDRFLNSVWLNGTLWTGGNDACTPPSDTTVRPCSRLIQVLTGTMTVNQNFDLGHSGGDLFYPVAWLAGSGDMFVGYNFSSINDYVGFRVAGQPVGSSPQTIVGAQTVQAGLALYNLSQCFPSYSGPNRWGDYGGAAFDPSTTGDVWVAGEYAGSNSSFPNCDWATYAQRLDFQSMPAPTVTGINPGGGVTAGGTSVVITGTGFTGATAVNFGSLKALFTINSDTKITATSSAQCAGAVDVTVSSAGGTSGTSSADLFTYTAPLPVVSSVNPNSGTFRGGTQVNIVGSGFTCATAVKFGSIAASSFTANSDTQITALSPAEAAGTIDVTVTTAGGTSATSAADKFTYKGRK
jgi:IPT/TIG domain